MNTNLACLQPNPVYQAYTDALASYQDNNNNLKFNLIGLAKDLQDRKANEIKHYSQFAKFILFFNEKNMGKICVSFQLLAVGMKLVFTIDHMASKPFISFHILNTALNVSLVAFALLISCGLTSYFLNNRIEKKIEKEWRQANQIQLQAVKEWYAKSEIYIQKFTSRENIDFLGKFDPNQKDVQNTILNMSRFATTQLDTRDSFRSKLPSILKENFTTSLTRK